ncbi:MAG: zinc dependent phospholipase C family protein [Candidatus Euphemobacter frigidus]|nr:zinc dependent phospholipase C family protein [Candidatus Euphemobacter frigidus]MDP8276232.1 zinc dependent phospholipase C family protein [Candidatus Euphemobacter frigidus]
MIWRDHKRLAAQMADAFDLGEFKDDLIKGSVEPDKKRTLVHIWPKSKRATKLAMYRARRAFLKGNLKRCARFLGIVSHFIADGMVHETIDTYYKSKEHSQIEDELGNLVEISAFPAIDSAGEGLSDGEFVFREIDALVRGGLDGVRLGRALSLLCSGVLSPPRAPEELIETRHSFVIRINRPPLKLLSIVAPAAGVLGTLLFHDPLWALLIPFALLLAGSPAIFRFLARYCPTLAAGALLGLIYRFGWDRLALTLLLAGISLYLFTIPDLSRLSEKWYFLNDKSQLPDKK